MDWEQIEDRVKRRIDELRASQPRPDFAFAEIGQQDLEVWQTGKVIAVYIEDATLVPLSDVYSVHRRIRADRGDVMIVVDYSDGSPHIELTIRDVRASVLRRLHLERLVDQVCNNDVITRIELRVDDPRFIGPEHFVGPEGPEIWDDMAPIPAGTHLAGSNETLKLVRRSRRARIGPDQIERAAIAYREGGIEAVKAVLFVADRQAWRYVQRAQDAGLLERARPRKEAT